LTNNQSYEQQGQPYEPPHGAPGQPHAQPYAQQSYAQQSYGEQQPYAQQPHEQQPYEQSVEPAAHEPVPAYGQPHAPSSSAAPGTPAAHAMPAGSAMPAASAAPAASATLTEQPPLTAAQRARAEGRSPVIEPGPVPAALTAVLALLLAGTAAVGPAALLLPLVVLQAVTAAGWFRLNGMWPARQGIALAFLGALAADAALLIADRSHAPAVLLATPGVWLLLALALQLRSRAGADERITGLMATIVSAALAIAAACHLAAEPDAVTVAGLAVAAAILVRAAPLPTVLSALLATAAAAAAGYGAAHLVGLTPRDAGLLGLGAGVCALIGHRVASYDYPSRFVHMTAGVALPLTAAAPAVYLLGRALT
jgi:hypothetical protein